MARYFLALKNVKGFALMFQQDLVVEENDIEAARAAVLEEAEDHGKFWKIVELVPVKRAVSRAGIFTMVDSRGALQLNRGRICTWATYAGARKVAGAVKLKVGEFKEVK